MSLSEHPCGDDLRLHMLHIADVLRERDYIETGWPVFAAVPLLLRRFGKRVRIVHLVRHPVYSACSMVTHPDHQAQRDDGYTRHAILYPADAGVRFKQYSSRWDGMSPYEKSLFHWAEINAYGLELGASAAAANPWFRVQMEQLVAPSSDRFSELLGFLGLPIRDGALAARHQPVDQHRTQTDLRLDWRRSTGIRSCSASLRGLDTTSGRAACADRGAVRHVLRESDGGSGARTDSARRRAGPTRPATTPCSTR